MVTQYPKAVLIQKVSTQCPPSSCYFWVRDSSELIMSYDYIDETRSESVRTHVKYFLGYVPDEKSGVNCLMTLSMGPTRSVRLP